MVLEELLAHQPPFQLAKRALERLLALGAAQDLDLQVGAGRVGGQGGGVQRARVCVVG